MSKTLMVCFCIPYEDTFEFLAAHFSVLQMVQSSVERDQVDVHVFYLSSNTLYLFLNPLDFSNPGTTHAAKYNSRGIINLKEGKRIIAKLSSQKEKLR